MSDTLTTISIERLNSAVNSVVQSVCPSPGNDPPPPPQPVLSQSCTPQRTIAVTTSVQSLPMGLNLSSLPASLQGNLQGTGPIILSLNLGNQSMIRLPSNLAPLIKQPAIATGNQQTALLLPPAVQNQGQGATQTSQICPTTPVQPPRLTSFATLPVKQMLSKNKSPRQRLSNLPQLLPNNAVNGGLSSLKTENLGTSSAVNKNVSPVQTISVPQIAVQSTPQAAGLPLLGTVISQAVPLYQQPTLLPSSTGVLSAPSIVQTADQVMMSIAATQAVTTSSLNVLSPATMRLLHSPRDPVVDKNQITSLSLSQPGQKENTKLSSSTKQTNSLVFQQKTLVDHPAGSLQQTLNSLNEPIHITKIKPADSGVDELPLHKFEEGEMHCLPTIHHMAQSEMGEDEDDGGGDSDADDARSSISMITDTTGNPCPAAVTYSLVLSPHDQQQSQDDDSISSTSPVVRLPLNIASSQLLSMDSIPSSTEINESCLTSVAQIHSPSGDLLVQSSGFNSEQSSVDRTIAQDYILQDMGLGKLTDHGLSNQSTTTTVNTLSDLASVLHYSVSSGANNSEASSGALPDSIVTHGADMQHEDNSVTSYSVADIVAGGDPMANHKVTVPCSTSMEALSGQDDLAVDKIVMSFPQGATAMSLAESFIMEKENQQSMAATVIDLILKSQVGSSPLNLERLGPQVPPDSCVLPRPIIDGPPLTSGIYCVDCNKMYEKKCEAHDSQFFHIEDTVILTRARMTLPKCLLFKYLNNQHTANNMGVVVNETIQCRTKFGPLDGLLTTKEELERPNETAYVWEVFEDGKSSRLLDCRSENIANWLMFVKRARTTVEQNVMVYQEGEHIYFVTCKEIIKGTELLYWYARDYARLLGVAQRPEDLFRCPQCGKQYPDIKSVNQHIKYIHPDMSQRPHKCSFCEKKFTSISKLNTHILCHMGVKPHKCQVCSKTFTDGSNLRMHLRLHTGEKPFSCGMCSRAFTQKAHLDAHMLVHTGERRLKCRFCTKLFVRPSDLKQHEYVHTQERVFTCSHNGCTKVFYKLQNYKRHIRIHSGIRTHSCEKCAKSFATKYHVQRHLKVCKGPETRDEIQPETEAELGLTIAKRRIQREEAMKEEAAAVAAAAAAADSNVLSTDVEMPALGLQTVSDLTPADSCVMAEDGVSR